MNRREFLNRSGMAVAGLGISQILSGDKARAGYGDLSKCHGANVLLITCHDLGRHLGCYGVETVHTQNLDALAAG